MPYKESKPAFSRLDPEKSGKFQRPNLPATASRGHKTVEYILFGTLFVILVLAVLALYTTYSPRHRAVPNTVDEGLKSDRVNVLLIGIGGDSHIGGGKQLADSLMLVSLKPSTRNASVISIPRDLYVKIGRFGQHRINQAHAIGSDSGYPGSGAGLTVDTVSGIFAQPIHGFVRLDFAAFEKIIDDLGGIDINVPRGFYDYLFKDRFVAGPQHMNGKRALRYARYRYVIGEEGDGFAREIRQQMVMDAVQEKLRARSPADLIRLLQTLKTVSNHTETNLTTPQIISLYRTFRDVDRKKIRHLNLKPYMQVFQLKTITDPGEAVRPKVGNFSEVQALARDPFNRFVPPAKGQVVVDAPRGTIVGFDGKPEILRPGKAQ